MTEGVTDFSQFQSSFERIADNIEKAIQGKDEVVRLSLVALVAEGHLLLEDVPGVGKTMLAKSLAKTLGCSWQRIQFTPDLLPSDVTGVNVWNKTTGAFGFKPGAVFANICLGDEINRASPKTQSALLECMEERQVTVDGGLSHTRKTVHGHRDTEPDRARGHLSPPRIAAGPVHDAALDWLPQP